MNVTPSAESKNIVTENTDQSTEQSSKVVSTRKHRPAVKPNASNLKKDGNKELNYLNSVLKAKVTKDEEFITIELPFPFSSLNQNFKHSLYVKVQVPATYTETTEFSISTLKVNSPLLQVNDFLELRLKELQQCTRFLNDRKYKTQPLFCFFRLIPETIHDNKDSITKLYNHENNVVWAKEEEKTLLEGITWFQNYKDVVEKWKQISNYVKTRTAKDCYTKYKKLWNQLNQKKSQIDHERDEMIKNHDDEPNELNATELSEHQNKVTDQDDSHTTFLNEDNTYADIKDSLSYKINFHSFKGFYVFFGSTVNLVIQCQSCFCKYETKLLLQKYSSIVMQQNYKCIGCSISHNLMFCFNICIPPSCNFMKIKATNSSVIMINDVNLKVLCDNCAKENQILVKNGGSNCINCFSCYSKLSINKLVIMQDDGTKNSNSKPSCAKDINNANKTKGASVKLVAGQPLPKNGACKHYSKSYRWFIWTCCKIPYPCPKCHDINADHKLEGLIATRFICGQCSKIHPVNTKECTCSLSYGQKKTAFWNGGKGCRNTATLSRKDSRKHKRIHK